MKHLKAFGIGAGILFVTLGIPTITLAAFHHFFGAQATQVFIVVIFLGFVSYVVGGVLTGLADDPIDEDDKEDWNCS